ncbi:MFS transporter [Ktedonosporobacter rubrisoli]|uniref:MFS transporter n=1 Tax=Ktedonosporobacter rubrisoli TaxID=2509675 RepID=A0A4P6JZZ2_KTERU|nr:MFS transporter [Ktedonosporobacter rubrisoli]QBD81488.1 MFS transporter [Ktedonosporobacter rubrisoli]
MKQLLLQARGRPDLSAAARLSIATRLLLTSAFLMNVGQFMILPFLAVYLTTTLHYPAWQVGTLLSANILCTRALPLAAGMIGDRLSHSTTILTGILVRSLGFLGLALFQSFPFLLGATLLMGTGGALYNPSIHSVFAAQPAEQHKRIFSTLNQVLNLGAVLGPLLGSLLLLFGPQLPFFGGSGLFFLIALTLFFFRQQYRTSATRTQLVDSFRQVLGHKHFMLFTLFMVLFWILFTQLTVAFPLEAFRISHNDFYVSAVYWVNGGTGFVLMAIVLKKVFQRYNPMYLVSIGMLCTGLGFALIQFFHTGFWLLCCVGIYTLGETLVLPGSDMVVADISTSSQENAGAFFGMFSLSWALGGAIGNYLGTALIESGDPAWSWTLYGLIGLVGCILTLWQARWRHKRA